MLLLACREGDVHALLSLALREKFGLTDFPPISRGPQGKPFFPAWPDIHFSLSHSGPYGLCAVGTREIGVDIEEVRPRSPGLPARVLTAAEYGWYMENGGDWPAFYTLWTRKESFCKREGRGVVQARRICPPLPGTTAALHSFSGPGWVAAVCSEAPLPAIRWVGETDGFGTRPDKAFA